MVSTHLHCSPWRWTKRRLDQAAACFDAVAAAAILDAAAAAGDVITDPVYILIQAINAFKRVETGCEDKRRNAFLLLFLF